MKEKEEGKPGKEVLKSDGRGGGKGGSAHHLNKNRKGFSVETELEL